LNEESEENISTTSERSKADYVCWVKLAQQEEGGTVDVPVVIVETKRLETINDKCIPQALSKPEDIKVKIGTVQPCCSMNMTAKH